MEIYFWLNRPSRPTVEDSQRHQFAYQLNQIFLEQSKFRFGLRELRNVEKTISEVFPTRF